MSITVVFDPPLPSDSPATFNQKAFSTLGDLNTWSTQANALATEVNQDEAALNAAVNAAATSATNAATSATNGRNSANAAAASLGAFDDRYLGSKASDPTTDNDGNALLTGALYWNTTAKEMRVWNGSSWQVAVGSLVGNADTATKLQTPRTITIGNTGKSVDGSANVSWSLAEIGVTAATETASGIVKLATAAEAQALTSAVVALTPARLVDAFGGANQSLSGNGYQKLPGGLIIQWGITGSVPIDGSLSVTFPIAFPTACASVVAQQTLGVGGTGVAVSGWSIPSRTSTGFQVNNDAAGQVFYWIAIGY